MSKILESCRRKLEKVLEDKDVLKLPDSDEVYFINSKEYKSRDVICMMDGANKRRDLFWALSRMHKRGKDYSIVELDLIKDPELLYSKKALGYLVTDKKSEEIKLLPNIEYIFKVGYDVGFNRVEFVAFDAKKCRAIVKFIRKYNRGNPADFPQDVLDNTVVDIHRLHKLRYFSEMTRRIPGNVAEIGVYKGGSSYILCKNNPGKMVYSIDTFEGMPESDRTIDHHVQGCFSDTTHKHVVDLLRIFNNSQVLRGTFPEIGIDLLKDMQFSLVHIDVDIYQSVMDCLEFFYPRMSDGGVLVLDDYFCRSTLGATKSVNEFFKNKPEIPVITAGMQVAIIKGEKEICF